MTEKVNLINFSVVLGQ